MQYTIESGVDAAFKEPYESYMLGKCGADQVPGPRDIRNGILHNYRPWEYAQAFRHGAFAAGDVVLDTGAMHTYFCIYLAQFVQRLHATDSFYWANRDYLRKQKLFTPEEWMGYVAGKGGGKIACEEADLMGLRYPDATFDKVLCISTIEHVLDDAKAMCELARVLKTGGRLLLTTEFSFHVGKAYSETDNSYYRVYTTKTLDALIAHSGLRPAGPVVVQNRNWIYLRKHVNAFVCLEKG